MFAACVDDGSTESSSPSNVDPTDPPPTDPPEPAGPHIARVEWHWVGCGPTATAVPFSLVVTMTVLSTNDTYEVKGQAVGCDAFNKNGQARPCTGHPASPVRMLTVSAGDANGTDTQSIPTVDCTDGKWVAP